MGKINNATSGGTGSAATTVTAFASAASKIEIFGFVNRITA